jgi:hypothetical protein
MADSRHGIDLGGLTPGEPVFYRVWFEDLARPGLRSAPVAGRLRAAPLTRRPIRICWSGDTVGQGWGINERFGGLRLYETMAGHSPDLFINSGDLIYADNPIVETVPLDDGTIWRNVTTPAKQKVAETLDEFRGNYAYYLSDAHAQTFNAGRPQHRAMGRSRRPQQLDARNDAREQSRVHREEHRPAGRQRRRALFDYCLSGRTLTIPSGSTGRTATDLWPRSSCSTSAAIAARIRPTSRTGRR